MNVTQPTIAIAKIHIKRDGWYEFEEGTVFKVLHITPSLIQVEDSLGCVFWLKAELLDVISKNPDTK